MNKFIELFTEYMRLNPNAKLTDVVYGLNFIELTVADFQQLVLIKNQLKIIESDFSEVRHRSYLGLKLLSTIQLKLENDSEHP